MNVAPRSLHQAFDPDTERVAIADFLARRVDAADEASRERGGRIGKRGFELAAGVRVERFLLAAQAALVIDEARCALVAADVRIHDQLAVAGIAEVDRCAGLARDERVHQRTAVEGRAAAGVASSASLCAWLHASTNSSSQRHWWKSNAG